MSRSMSIFHYTNTALLYIYLCILVWFGNINHWITKIKHPIIHATITKCFKVLEKQEAHFHLHTQVFCSIRP